MSPSDKRMKRQTPDSFKGAKVIDSRLMFLNMGADGIIHKAKQIHAECSIGPFIDGNGSLILSEILFEAECKAFAKT
jgi:hypothetical protein